VCFVLLGGAIADLTQPPRLYTPIDDKPKRVDDPHTLARVRDLIARDDAHMLVDRWDEDWSHLGWVRLQGHAQILEPDGTAADERDAAIRALRAKYPQYRRHRLEARPLIRILVTRASSWGRLGPAAVAKPAAG
jgi:PPOX class probable F420-dependent enzyme